MMQQPTETGSDATTTHAAEQINLLNHIMGRAIMSLKKNNVITWQVQFNVVRVDQYQRPRTEKNIHIRCDSTTKANKSVWALQFKEMVHPEVLATLKCSEFWVVLSDKQAEPLSPVDLSLPPEEFQQRYEKYKAQELARQQEINALRIAAQPKTLEDGQFENAQAITSRLIGKLGLPEVPNDKPTCGKTTRCDPCNCPEGL